MKAASKEQISCTFDSKSLHVFVNEGKDSIIFRCGRITPELHHLSKTCLAVGEGPFDTFTSFILRVYSYRPSQASSILEWSMNIHRTYHTFALIP